MRHLIDTYIQAEDSAADLGFRRPVAGRADRRRAAPTPSTRSRRDRGRPGRGRRDDREQRPQARSSTRSPINPRYYERMSTLLDALIEQRRRDAICYRDYLERVPSWRAQSSAGRTATRTPRRSTPPPSGPCTTTSGTTRRPPSRVDEAVRRRAQDGWRDNPIKTRRVRTPSAAPSRRSPATRRPIDDRWPTAARLVQSHDEY